MRRFSAIAALIFFGSIFPLISFAQVPPSWEAWALNKIISVSKIGEIYMEGDTIVGTNGICVKYGEAVLMADSASVNTKTGEVLADGNVRIEEGGLIWTG